MRGGAGVARWAHNPKVVGSNPAPATEEKAGSEDSVFLFLYGENLCRQVMFYVNCNHDSVFDKFLHS